MFKRSHTIDFVINYISRNEISSHSNHCIFQQLADNYEGGYLNDDDDTIDQDLSSLTSFDGLQVIGKDK